MLSKYREQRENLRSIDKETDILEERFHLPSPPAPGPETSKDAQKEVQTPERERESPGAHAGQREDNQVFIFYITERNPGVVFAQNARTIPGCQVQLMVAVATTHA